MKVNSETWFPPAVMLKDACPSTILELTEQLRKLGASQLTGQLDDVWIALQALDGTPESFSFLAYTVPGLTFEQRQSMDLQDTESIEVNLGPTRIRIALDDFGQINWFYVKNLPGMYGEIRKFMPA